MRICNLSSGSKGNLTYVESGNTKALVDIGLSMKETIKRLNLLGVLPEEINAIFVTHEHIDHIKGISSFSAKYSTPIYVHYKGLDALKNKVGELTNLMAFNDTEFNVGDLGVSPFAVPHDVVRCTGYSFFEGEKKISITTDLGHTTPEILKNLSGSSIVYLEANHDEKTLLNNPKYPNILKRRILGANGHLSNLSAAETIFQLIKDGTKQVVLSHLSEENNSPTLAYDSICARLAELGVIEGKHVRIDVATLLPGVIFKL